ncbi:MAG: T9SS type A sorting domain-containing protein [Bacteroidetes bacterium]|nr:T9SS type A sorting domain-containing protein [Bacteroidota bacterium]MCB0709962.1 T9SS type A sorting domain-containing protein [Chitinophagaceae bacterium]
MRIKILLTNALFFIGSSLFAQNFVPTGEQSSTGQSGTGANINVVYHRCEWTIDPRSGKNISGTVTTYFKTTQANVSTINFDLNKNSFNNGSLVVTYHGTACTKSFPSSGAVNILNITLPSNIPASNTLDSISITYSGTPPGVSGAAQGYQVGGTGSNRYINTLSESYEDRDWWPCKADMQDKIDSMDIIVHVPWITASNDTFWVASNGVLLDSTITSSTSRRFIYKTRYPIASYLVAVSVAKFTRYHRSVDVNGTTTPVVYYLLSNASSKATKVANMDKINPVLQAFSNKFGDYPFKLEKHGYYDGLLGADGMEHQTFSSIASSGFSLRTLTHELMHQWFGDNVTFATWNDLWLAEGFARYSEALAAELVPSLGYSAYSTLNGFKSSALSLNTASTWIPNSYMATSNLIWNSSYGSTVYERGSMIVSMLRALAGDAKFFQACTNYQTNMKGKAATTDSLKNYFNAVLGTDISAFFDDYVGGSGSGTTAVGGIGNPINTVNWNSPSANKLFIQMGSQSRTSGSNVSYFRGPVVVHATNAASGWTKDTTITFFDWGGGNMSYAGNGLSAPTTLLYYKLSFTPTHLFYDDSARTLSTGSTFKLSTLAASVINFSGHKTATGNQLSLSLVNTSAANKIEIEKSINGIDFSTAGQMDEVTSNGQTNNYLYNDAFPYDGYTFYRAKIYYATGTEITNIIKIESNKKSGILTISPNPASNIVKIAFNNSSRNETMVKITNAEGKVVYELITNKEILNYDVSGLANGVYMVSIIQNGALIQSNKLIVKH